VIIGHGCKIPGRVIEIGGEEKIGSAVVGAVHAYNSGKPFHPKGAGAGYIVQFKSARIYVAGDTDIIPEMADVKCDVAILPIGGTYTMDVNEASDAVAKFLPKLAIPYHYNYLSDTKADAQNFARLVDEKTGRKTMTRILIQ
jgi:L-ascorbate metabolism protein UlaG (beta-lactamase superfamily)